MDINNIPINNIPQRIKDLPYFNLLDKDRIMVVTLKDISNKKLIGVSAQDGTHIIKWEFIEQYNTVDILVKPIPDALKRTWDLIQKIT